MNDEYPYILKIVKQKLQIMKTFKRLMLSEIQFRNLRVKNTLKGGELKNACKGRVFEAILN
jgi:hypothetical protein